MIPRKDNRLVDLEYMIPTEFKEDRPLQTEEINTESRTVEGWACHSCSRGSDEATLLPVVHMGERKLICPRCLKRIIDSDNEYSAYSSLDEGLPDNIDSQPTTTSSENSPMSMFD